MKSIYVITMWSGGRPAKKWKSDKEPVPLPQGNGISFVSSDTKLPVQIIGSISVEEFESGKEEIEGNFYQATSAQAEDASKFRAEPNNIQRIF
jgi:hypothetical protein